MKCQLCQVFVRILEDVKEKENKIMARKDYDQFADELIAAVGGKENIVSVTNCMTRLRFVLADESIVKDDEVKKIKGVMSVVHVQDSTRSPSVLMSLTCAPSSRQSWA